MRVSISWKKVGGSARQGDGPSDYQYAASDCADYGAQHGLNWCSTDQYFGAAAREAGVVTTPTIFGSPPEHAPQPDCAYHTNGALKICRPKDSSLDEWTVFVAQFVLRYGRDGDYWNQVGLGGGQYNVRVVEIWNEPNLAGFWDDDPGDPWPDSSEYIKVLSAAADGRDFVANAKPLTQLAAPSFTLAGGDNNNNGRRDYDEWMHRFSNQFPHKRYEGVSLHPYGATVAAARSRIDYVRSELPNKQMRLTESGWGAGCRKGIHGRWWGPANQDCNNAPRSLGEIFAHEDAQRDRQRQFLNQINRNYPFVESFAYFKGIDFSRDADSTASFARYGLYRGVVGRDTNAGDARPIKNLIANRAAQNR